MFDELKHMPLVNGTLRRPPGLYGMARRLISRVASMDSDAREAFQRERVARVLKVARTLPGYSDAPASNELSQWPILTKARIAGREKDFCGGSILPAVPAATGGTTGQPLKLSRTWRSVALEQAVIDHLCLTCSLNTSVARIAVLRGDSIKPANDMQPPFWVDEGPVRRIFSAHHLSRDTIRDYVAALRDFRPDILLCYPSSLSNLLELIDNSETFQIPLVFASSEVLPQQTMLRARQDFGANVIDFYGHAERIVCAWSLNGEGYRFLPAYGHVELIPDGPGLARIVATSLTPRGQIFVRYDTGDLLRVPSSDPRMLREISVGVRPFQGIDGRASEFVDIADGRRIIGLNHIPRGVEGAISIQICKVSECQIDLYIVPADSFSAASGAQLIANFRQKFPASVEARAIFVQHSVREKNGKAPLLLRAPDLASISPTKSRPALNF